MMVRASLVSLLATALLLGCGGSDDPETVPEPAVTGPLDEKGNDLFVLRGPAEVADGRIEVTTEVVEWFNDRPKRNAGVASAEELVEKWQGYGFAAEPPNAALAGEETDAEVELTKPKVMPDGVSFAYKSLRGEVASEDDAMSVFIDSSEWETDMHVYVFNQYTMSVCPGAEQATLENPTIVTAPSSWSVPPPQTFEVPYDESDQGAQIFNAASKSGGTSFEVRYELHCPAPPESVVSSVAELTIKGKVPDSLDSNSFSCSLSGTAGTQSCESDGGSGYHVTSKVKLYAYPSDAQAGGGAGPQPVGDS